MLHNEAAADKNSLQTFNKLSQDESESCAFGASKIPRLKGKCRQRLLQWQWAMTAAPKRWQVQRLERLRTHKGPAVA